MNICEKFRSINLESNLYFQIFYIKQIKHFGKIFFDDLAKYFEICFQIFGKEDEARGLTLDRVLKKNTNTCFPVNLRDFGIFCLGTEICRKKIFKNRMFNFI